MLTAIRKSDNQKVIGYEIEKNDKESYSCDYCNNQVIHHKSNSQVRIGHFKHKSNPDCANNIAESAEHLWTKKSILDYLSNKYLGSFSVLELEKWICNNSIRSDIYVETKKGNKVAIEIQASQLTIDQIINRTEKYTNNGIHVIWILVWKKSNISKSDFVTNRCLSNFHCDHFDEFDHSVKLKEMELFIHWMNFKKLILWDFESNFSNKFIIVDLDIFKSEGAEFYTPEGEYQSFDGRIAKNKKNILDIWEADFEEFKPSSLNSFKVPSKNYLIPYRNQMVLFKKT